jgi:pimeloyl-ACP methyl ester carboxylesterase
MSPARRARCFTGFVMLAICASSWSAPPRQHQVPVEGFALTVWEKSPAKPRATLLLVHGRTWSALPNFDLQAPAGNLSLMDALARDGYAAYAVDLRGYGATPRDGSGWLTPTRAAADVVAVLRWIHHRHPRLAQKPALIGYSRGAHVALLAAQQNPEALSTLVLFALPPVTARQASVPPAEPPRQATTRAAAAEDFITPGAATPAVIEAYVSQAVAANPVRVDWRDEHQFVFDAALVKAPTLILFGANDPLLTNESVLKFFAALATQDRAFVVLPGSDHAAHVENSQREWLRVVTGFLEPRR